MRLGDRENAECRLLRAQAQLLRNGLAHHFTCKADIEATPPAQEVARIEAARQQIAVGHSGRLATLAIAGGARHGAGAARANPEGRIVIRPSLRPPMTSGSTHSGMPTSVSAASRGLVATSIARLPTPHPTPPTDPHTAQPTPPP